MNRKAIGATAFVSITLAWAALTFQPARAQTPAGNGVVALTGATLIDGTGAPAMQGATIVIANGQIQAAGRNVNVPAGATRVNLAGKTVMPGLISSHSHLDNGDKALAVRDRTLQQLRLYAQYGVTTVVSLTDEGVETTKIRDENDSGPLDRARLFPSGPAVVAKTVEDARTLVNKNADLRVHILKTRLNGNANDMTPEIYGAVIDQAHKRGLRVAAHLFYLHEAKGLVNAGLDVIAHSIRDQDVDPAFIAELKRRNIGYIPTLTRDLSVFVYETPPAFLNDPFFLKGITYSKPQLDQVKDPAFQARMQQNPETKRIKLAIEQASRNLKLLSDAGVMIAMGTDSGTMTGRWQGYFEHVELELMVKAGMTPMQTLVAATSGSARAMKLDRLGTIQAGNKADLLVLNADPLTDIRNTRQIHSVWMDGRQLPAVISSN